MSLKLYFPISDHSRKAEFDALLDDLYAQTDSFCYITHYKTGRFHCTSPSFETITGYTVGEFEEEGVNFFVKRLPQEDTLYILKTQAEHFKKAQVPSFNPSDPMPLAMVANLPTPDGTPVKYIGTGMPLAYLPTREVDIALMIITRVTGKKEIDDRTASLVLEQLVQVKLLFNEIYPVPKGLEHPLPGPLEIVSGKDPHHPLSTKEKQVLQKIAQGASSKEIAAALFISENTVETHRKNLLLKLEAKNVAELIKKASKLYWLE
jgi:DNA-binding CsgD family transcriptional regulator